MVAQLAKKSILIVEDEAITALEIQACLKRLGYQVNAIAASGKQALDQALQSSPDLVLMDITLKGGQDGITTVKQLHTRMNVPVIYLTAFADDTTLQRAKQTEPYGYIVKPFQEQELRTTIETAIYRHQMDKILRDREEWYASLLTSLSDAIITTDLDSRITLMNPMAEVLTGWDIGMARGKNILEVFTLLSEQGDVTKDVALVSLAIRENRPQKREGILRSPTVSPSERWVTVSASPIRAEEGTIKGVALVFQDVSERKHAEEQLRQTDIKIRQSQKMEAIGTLAGGIAHDFNNILTAILGFTQLTLSQVSPSSPIEDSLQMILTAAHRAKELVQQILAFSRQNGNDYRPIDIQTLVSESLKLLRAALPATIDLRQDLSQGTGTVLADSTQLQQVVMNLCTNAKQAMDTAGGVLEISLHSVEIESNLIEYPHLKPGPHVRLRISDTGSGIAPEVIPRIFDPFFTTKQVGEGTGMGLALVHSIITSHQGSISVHSELGRGTTFEILLPTIEQEPDLSEVSPTPEPQTGKGRILFVDDEMALAKLGEEILKGLGYQVTSYTSCLKALEGFEANPSHFDVVISDQTMPSMSGEQLIMELRRIRKDIPAILCTGFMTSQNRERAKKLGIQAVLTKPWSTQNLATTLKQILENKDLS